MRVLTQNYVLKILLGQADKHNSPLTFDPINDPPNLLLLSPFAYFDYFAVKILHPRRSEFLWMLACRAVALAKAEAWTLGAYLVIRH
jgi:hypothetical protein